MLIQRAGSGTLPPPGFTRPPWAALQERWASHPAPSTSSVTIGPASFFVGHDDSELDDVVPGLAGDVVEHEFGWDNESPRREVTVDRFSIDWRPITNGDYFKYWKPQHEAGATTSVPASWTVKDGEYFVSFMPSIGLPYLM